MPASSVARSISLAEAGAIRLSGSEISGVADYQLMMPAKVVFGWGSRKVLGEQASRFGRRALLVVGSRTLESTGVVDELAARLRSAALDVVIIRAPHREPTIADVDAAAAESRQAAHRDGTVVVGLGGGSGIDLAKAVAGMAAQSCVVSVQEFLEGIGSGRQLTERPWPVIALPTTAGTGAEATRNAVISAESHAAKKSLRADGLMPAVAIIDPELTVSSPPWVTAHAGLDAVTQLIESFISRRRQPVTRMLAKEGLRAAWSALPRAIFDGADRAARERMAHAAFLSGVCLANSGLGIAHGLAAALGARCGIPHGLACAASLPLALRLNRSTSERCYADLERHLHPADAGEVDANLADRFVDRTTALVRDLGVPSRWRDLGIEQPMLPTIVRDSHGNSRAGNPCDMDDSQLLTELEAIW